jgi:restriction system protein
MARKSGVEDLLEASFKNPIVGSVASIVLAGVGFYLSHKGSPQGPEGAITNSTSPMFGKVMYMLAGLFFLASVFGYVVGAAKKKKKAAFFEQKDTLGDLKALPWRDFEEYVGTLFEKLGYSVQVTGGLKDGGIDLVVSKAGKTHFVQCKKYRERQVTLSMVRDFYGAMSSRRNLEGGFFVTTGTATLDARKFAEENSIELIDGARLLEYVRMSKGSP